MELKKPAATDIESIRDLYSKWWVDDFGNAESENITFFTNLVLESITHPEAKEKYFLAVDEEAALVGIVGYAEIPATILKEYIDTQRPLQLTVLMVDKASAGRGVGTEILRKFESWAKENAFEELVLTSSERWKDSWPFYTKNGYHDLGELKNENNWHTKVFNKTLKR